MQIWATILEYTHFSEYSHLSFSLLAVGKPENCPHNLVIDILTLCRQMIITMVPKSGVAFHWKLLQAVLR